MVTNTKELIEAFAEKAQASSLKVDCPSDGLFNSEICIIAEAPGPREALAGSPLVGGSGSLLWSALRRNGIARTDCYITNLSKRQLSFEEDDRKSPLGKHEFDQWAELLKWELSQLPNLKYIVACGGFAFKALTGHDGITSWRGSVVPVTLYNYEGGRPHTVTVIASLNPAAVLRNPKDELVFQMDMARVKRVVDGRWKAIEIGVDINPSFNQAREYIRGLRSSGGPIAHDIETAGGETACFGFSNDVSHATCINLRTRTENRYSLEEELILRHDIQDLYSQPGLRFVAQNNMFDSSWLWYKDKIKVQPIWFDTMLAHHTLYPWMPHNLGFICTQYTTHPYYKDEREAWKENGDIDRYWRYNGTDCAITLRAALAMERELEQQNLHEFFHSHVMRLQPHLIRMVVGGIKVDLERRESIHEELTKEVEKYKDAFHAAVYDALGDEEYKPNPLSFHQLSDLLFNKLRLVGRGPSTDDENRKRMYNHPRTSEAARRVLSSLDKYKEEQKFFSTYVDTEIDEDGRMRCEYKQTGVSKAPGRLSSSKVLWGHYDTKSKQVIQHGMNLQNQPERAHGMFIADDAGEQTVWIDGSEVTIPYEDYDFAYFDGSQAEARYVGWDAEMWDWIEQFEQARLDGEYDAHRALASTMFNVPYQDVPTADHEDIGGGRKKPTIRYIAKRCRHGLNYRMMPDRLATTAGLPSHEAQRAFELYHRINPRLSKNWWPGLEAEVRKTRYLFNAYGRRLFVQGRLDDPTTLESIVAFKPQSTIGDKVARVIYQSESDPDWPYDARIGLNIHDALIALTPKSKTLKCLSIMGRYMEEPIIVKPSMPPLIIPADFKVAAPDETGKRRWSNLKKIKREMLDLPVPTRL